MKLSKFLKENGIKQKFFASQIGVSQVTVCNWLKKKSTPSKSTQKRIDEYIADHYQARYPDYYSWCCDALAEGVFTCRDNSAMKEGTCSKCGNLDYVSNKKKENSNAG